MCSMNKERFRRVTLKVGMAIVGFMICPGDDIAMGAGAIANSVSKSDTAQATETEHNAIPDTNFPKFRIERILERDKNRLREKSRKQPRYLK